MPAPLSFIADNTDKNQGLIVDYMAHLSGELGIQITTKPLKGNDTLNEVDGIRIDRKDAWALIRPSGTEPLVRLYVESSDESIAKEFEQDILSCISSFI